LDNYTFAGGYLTEDEELIRKELANEAHWLYKRGYVNGRWGNISYRMSNGVRSKILIKPSKYSFCKIKPYDFSLTDVDGNLLFGEDPSSELPMHLAIYKTDNNPDNTQNPRKVIIHTHPTQIKDLCNKFTFPEMEYTLTRILTEDELEGLEKQGIAVVPDLRRGSTQLADASKEKAKNAKVLILWRHGLVTIGETIKEAKHLTEEFCDACGFFKKYTLPPS
jgi:ribulose-5-phosphate 4-epimerase/fuculose-1-phosphate aldolase